MTSVLVQVKELSDTDFLDFARLFGRGEMRLNEYVELCDMVKQRCNSLGYTWQRGCCGTNNLIKIEYANKKK